MLSLTTIRFFPNLEEIPEESRCSTIMKERKEDEGEKCLQLHQGESESGNRNCIKEKVKVETDY